MSISGYSSQRKQNPNSGLNEKVSHPAEIKDNEITFNLFLFSDGVNIKKSTLKRELWPIWIQLADLPTVLRMSRKNFVLASLFVGSSHPEWKELVPHIKGQLLSPVTLWPGNINPIRAHFKVRLIVSDPCAKCHILNMMKFNGYYGCHFCTAEGVTIRKMHAYYPYYKSGQLQDASINNLYVYYAENFDAKKPLNVVGVNGRSAFADIVDGLPLRAPIDYMHCVLLGVFQELLKLRYKSLSSDDKTTTAQIVADLSCPRKMIAFSRKIRSLEELSQFKANEYFNWLLYLSPLIFLSRIPRELYEHLCNLVFGVRLLLSQACPQQFQLRKIFWMNFVGKLFQFIKMIESKR